MAGPTNFRQERIEKLLHELEYEVTRGMMEKDIDEELTFRFVVPISSKIPDGVVFCQFRTRPAPRYEVLGDPEMVGRPRLRIIPSS